MLPAAPNVERAMSAPPSWNPPTPYRFWQDAGSLAYFLLAYAAISIVANVVILLLR